YLARREPEPALEQARRTLELYPDSFSAHGMLGLCHLATGALAEAAAVAERGRRFEPGFRSLAYVGFVYARSGMREQARQLLAELREYAQTRFTAPTAFAAVHAGLGENDEAFAWLQKARDDRSHGLFYLQLDRWWDGLRSDARFRALLRDVGLPVTNGEEATPIDSLAVLPLANAAADPDLEFLSDGITEGIINLLARVSGL